MCLAVCLVIQSNPLELPRRERAGPGRARRKNAVNQYVRPEDLQDAMREYPDSLDNPASAYNGLIPTDKGSVSLSVEQMSLSLTAGSSL